MDDQNQEEQTVNLVNPSGDLVSVPQSQVQDALVSSYRQPTDQDISSYKMEQKYGTPGQQAITGLEGAAQGLIGPLAPLAETKLLNVNPEDIKARKEINPKTHTGFELAGFAAPAIATAGATGLAGLGVEGAAEAIPAIANAAKFTQAGILEGIGSAAAKASGLGAEGAGLASRVGANAIKGAIEGGLYQTNDEVSKMILSDPSKTNFSDLAETAGANIGLTGLLGGAVLGAGSELLGSGAKGLWNATIGKKIAPSLEMANSAINNASMESPEMSGIPTTTDQQGEALSSSAQIPRKNAYEVSLAAERLGIPSKDLSEGTLSSDPKTRWTEGSLAENSATTTGDKVRANYQKMYQPMEQKANNLLVDRTTQDQDVVGKQLKEDMVDALNEKFAPTAEGYNSKKAIFKEMDINPEVRDAHLDSVINHPSLKTSPELQPQVDKIIKKFQGATNLNELKELGTSINSNLRAAYKNGTQDEITLWNTAKQAAKGIRESTLQAAKYSGKFGLDDLQDIRNLDAQHYANKQLLQRIGVETGLGKNIGSVGQLEDKMSGMSDMDFYKRVINPKDAESMQFMKDNLPDQFNLAQKRFKQDIFEKSLDDEKNFNMGKFVNQTSSTGPNKLTTNAKKILFGENGAQAVSDIDTLKSAIPGNPSPTKTFRGSNIGNFLSKQGLVDEATDAMKYKWLKAKPHLDEIASRLGNNQAATLATLKAAASADKEANPSALKATYDFIASAIKGENSTSKAVKSMFDAGRIVLPSQIIDQKRLDKLDNKLKDIQSNNSQMLNNNTELSHYMPDQTAALAQTSMNAVNYLNSLRPKVDKMNPLDEDNEPSQVQKTAFKNALTIAEQPLTVLNDVKEGSVSPQDILSMKTMYPALYQRVSNKLYTNLIEHTNDGKTVPYNTRLGLSLFLGRPLDSTMTPQAIMSNQPQNNNAMTSNDKQQAMKHQNAHGAHSMKNIGQLATIDQTPQQARIANKMKA